MVSKLHGKVRVSWVNWTIKKKIMPNGLMDRLSYGCTHNVTKSHLKLLITAKTLEAEQI